MSEPVAAEKLLSMPPGTKLNVAPTGLTPRVVTFRSAARHMFHVAVHTKEFPHPVVFGARDLIPIID